MGFDVYSCDCESSGCSYCDYDGQKEFLSRMAEKEGWTRGTFVIGKYCNSDRPYRTEEHDSYAEFVEEVMDEYDENFYRIFWNREQFNIYLETELKELELEEPDPDDDGQQKICDRLIKIRDEINDKLEGNQSNFYLATDIDTLLYPDGYIFSTDKVDFVNSVMGECFDYGRVRGKFIPDK